MPDINILVERIADSDRDYLVSMYLKQKMQRQD